MKQNPTPPRKQPILLVQVFQRVYRLLYSKVLGVLLFLAMAILGLIGTLVMQAPMTKYLDPAGYQNWLPNAEAKYGVFTKIFDFLGFFSLWSSPLFLGVTVLLGMSIIACTTHRFPLLRKKTLYPRIHVSDRFFQHAQYRAQLPCELSTDEAYSQVTAALKAKRLRVLPDPKAPNQGWYADRNRFAPFGTVIAHASFVIILAAFGVSAFTGFERSLELPIGMKSSVGNGSGLEVTATSFQDSYDETGRPTDYVSHLEVSKGGKKIAEQDVRVNTPLVVDGYRFHQASFGIAANITVTGPKQLQLGTHAVALKWTSDDGMNAVGRLDLPKLDREIIVATAASGQRNSSVPAGSALIEVYQISTNKRLDAKLVDQGKSDTFDNLQISFDRESQYSGVIVRKDPGAIWMWIGSGLLIIGMVMTFGFRHRRYWVRIASQPVNAVSSSAKSTLPTGAEIGTEQNIDQTAASDKKKQTWIYLATVEEPDSILDREFRDLAQEIANRCGLTEKTEPIKTETK